MPSWLLAPLWLICGFLICSPTLFASERGFHISRHEKFGGGERVLLTVEPPQLGNVDGPDQQSYSTIQLAGTGTDNEVGHPGLPVLRYECEVPTGLKMTASLQGNAHNLVKVPHPLWPHQKPVPKATAESLVRQFERNAEAYAGVRGQGFRKARKPELVITHFRKRGKDYAELLIRPFEYDPSGKVVRYPSELVLNLSFVAPNLPRAAGPRTGPITTLDVEVRTPEDLQGLEARGLNFERRSRNRVRVYATATEAQELQAAGYLSEELILAAPAAEPNGAPQTGDYHTYATLTAELQAMAAQFPTFCHLTSIGRSMQGRELWALKITDPTAPTFPKPQVRLASTLHGDEPVGTELLLYLADFLLYGGSTNARVAALLNSTEIWLLPLLNPDGLEFNTRFNAGGFDLNRSFPDGGGGGLGNPLFGPEAGLEGRPPEVASLMRFALTNRFTLAANFHTGALLVNYPYDDDDLGSVESPSPDDLLFKAVSRAYASNNPPMSASAMFPSGIVNGAAWYVIQGGMQDWHYRYLGCNEVTVELTTEKRPPASTLPQLWDDNRESMLQFISTAHTGVSGQVTDASTGQPLHAAAKPIGIENPVFTNPHSGIFHRMLLPGTYDFLVTAPGYDTVIQSNVVVAPGQRTEVNVALAPLTIQPDRILLVTAQSMETGLHPLVSQKREEGFSVQSLIIPDGSRPDRIRAAIRQVYSIFPAEYIVLLGDHEIVPAFTNGAATDLPYGLIDAGETFADYLGRDAILGRVSLKNAAGLSDYAQKLASFARARINRLHDLTWVAQGNTSSEWTQAERGHESSITNSLPPYYRSVRFYSTNGTAADLTRQINGGTDGVIYSGHGSSSGWARFNYDAEDLGGVTNLDRTPIVIGHCCQSARFELDVCFAEAWLQTASRAVVYVGATADTYWDEDEVLEKAEFEAMKYTVGLSIGRALEQGLHRMGEVMPGNAQYYHTIYHVLGDPTASLIDTTPQPLTIQTPAQLPPASLNAPYHVSLSALGGVGQHSWIVSAGQLPPGLKLNGNDAVLSGNATNTGTYIFRLQVSDASTPAQSAEREFTLMVWNPSTELNQALDTSLLTWNVGSVPWFLQNTTTRDGVDAAQSGAINDGQMSWIECRLSGPGLLTFWWRVSSELDYDFLEFYIDGLRLAQISGVTGWQQSSSTLAEGPHTVRWAYVKDSNTSEGQDAGFVDQVTFLQSQAPIITQQPVSQTVVQGDMVQFTIAATGIEPLACQWFGNGLPIPGASSPTLLFAAANLGLSGAYFAVVTNSFGSVTSLTAQLTIVPGIGLVDSLDASELQFTTTALSPWTGQNLVTHDGIDAAMTGGPGDNQQSWLETSVSGPGILTFWWRVSCEPDYDVFRFQVNGLDQGAPITGETEWQFNTIVLPAGAQQLRWIYEKDGSRSEGQDRGWVDQVQFTPAVAPLIATQPENRTVVAGDPLLLSVLAAGISPLNYQWYRNGSAVAGATAPTLSLPAVQLTDAGGYHVTISNLYGTVTSVVAHLSVALGTSLADALDLPGIQTLTGGDVVWTGQRAVTSDGVDAAQSGSINHGQLSWLELVMSGPGLVSFWWKVSSEPGYDGLEFRLDGQPQVEPLTGEIDWTEVTVTLPTGVHTLRWTYFKDGAQTFGLDRGWVDQVRFTASLTPVVIVEPQDITVHAGDAALLSVTAQGASPMEYQWVYNNQPLPSGNGAELLLTAAQIESGGTYYVVLTNSYGTATSRVARLDVLSGLSLSEALDNSDLSFATGGNLPWQTITNGSQDAVDSARSGPVGHNGQSWIQTTLTGPGRLSFWWNVSSEICCDELALLLDGNVIEVIRGLMDWTPFSLDVAEGPHVVRWVYLKDGTVSAGADAGGVDQVTFTPWTSNNVHVVSSTQSFGFPASGPANVYPSTLEVSNLAAGVTELTVTLQGLSHTFPDDLDILLVGPNQAGVLLLSDVGGGIPISNAVVTLADFAPIAPNDGPIVNGFYRPTDVASDSDLFPVPAPGEPYATNLSAFANTDPNGTWRLFIRDDSDGDSGSLQGWSLNFRLQTNSLVPFKLGSTLAFGEISLRFPTSPSAEYMVEYKDALDQTAWQSLLAVPGDGTVQSVRQPVVPGANRFFRVRMEPGTRR